MWNALRARLAGLLGNKTRIGALPGGAAAAAIDPSLLPAVIVLANEREQEIFERDLVFHLGSDGRVLSFPADDVRPYDGFSPHPDIPRQRMQALHALQRGEAVAVVASAPALMHRVLRPEVLQSEQLTLSVGEEIDRDALISRLVTWGYLVSGVVEEVGSVGVRGDVVDVWPTGAEAPVRIELFDDELERMRAFDPATQRSGDDLKRVRLLPAREALVTSEALTRAPDVLAEAVDAMGSGHGTRRRVLEELREGIWFPGGEDYLPALHELCTLWDYWGRILVIDEHAVADAVTQFDELIRARWEHADPRERPTILPERRYASPAEVEAALADAPRLEPMAVDIDDIGARDNDDLRVGGGELAPVIGRLDAWLAEHWQVALVCESRSRAERVRALFEPHGLPLSMLPAHTWPEPGHLALWVGDLPRGFRSPVDQLAIVSVDEIFGARARPVRTPKTLKEAMLTSVTDLKTGDLVVHIRHGIGRFEGLKRLPVPGGEQDFALVMYRGDDRMYLPVTRFDQLYRYRAVGDARPRLDKLGGQTWARRKAKVKDRVLAMAGDLLRLHAMRAVVEGHPYEGKPETYRTFVESFPYVETPDQQAAIDDVLDDLSQPEPMDRLVVGDVGFGKTEVAMRAAMRVLLEDRQVAVLCPTTVLCFQHERTFKQRFEDLPVRIEALSRLRSPAEARAILADAAEGKVDILIGTTSLLGRTLRFKNLGLVVVDEEHRFGVKQKEKLKRMFPAVEYLAMSATPIPRTLHMALTGLRKVSVITTPPAERLPVRTKVARYSNERIAEDIHRELSRGGQAFFVHNRVGSIEAIARTIRELVPQAKVGVAHGQMDEKHMETVLVQFIRRELHVLVCTTIIESGVDLPNVNTMIVNRADTLGLAQLYQLRGRVGRGKVRGYCTLLVPSEGRMDKLAMRRLRTMQENTDLGAGFTVASRDLELRGSGNLLGDAQHGQIQAVGFDTYVELLEEAVQEAGGQLARERIDPEIEVPVTALIPEDYMPDIEDRLHEYRRLAMCVTPDQVRGLVDEWEDRFGEPPAEVLNLGWLAETRVRCRELGIERASWLKVKAVLQFSPHTPVDPAVIVELVSKEDQRFSVKGAGGPTRLEVRFTPEEAEYPFRFLYWVLSRLKR